MNVGGDVPRPEGRPEEARGQRHHHQLPGRLLRRPHPRLSLPRLPRAAQRGPGRRPASATSARRRPWSPGTILTKGRPGYISDPVIDTAKRQIIYAHCVASNRAFGPQGAANPFEILTHSEDRQGASVRSHPARRLHDDHARDLDPNRKEILFHQAKAVGNDPDDRACRTKLVRRARRATSRSSSASGTSGAGTA
ncbi:MAG: hypothetical protein MZV49_06300 [Rhodopseudomonas palustris]|nr:hypothetical protein [Rhodopseudomonas palustris]